MGQFRFVFFARTDVRLMQRAADEPRQFRFEHGPGEAVLVRDIVDYVDEIPRHRVLEVQVACQGDELSDVLLDHARALAESTLILLSTAARAPTADVDFFVAYQTEPPTADRAFLQWHQVDELPAARAPVPDELIEQLWSTVMGAASNQGELAHRVVLSMSWYRRALRETEDLFRFTNLWLALEALNPRLSDHFGIDEGERAGLPGARRLLKVVLGEDETFTRAVAARNDLLHANRVLPNSIRERVHPIIPRIDDCLMDGWRRLLSIPADVPGPSSSVRPHPHRYVLRGAVQPDAEGWSENRHPWFAIETTVSPRDAERPGSVTFDQTQTLTIQNAVHRDGLTFELRGPETPNPPQVEGSPDAVKEPATPPDFPGRRE